MNIPVFDAHCDTIYRVWQNGGGLRCNSYHIDLERAKRFTPYAQVFAVFGRPVSGIPVDYSRLVCRAGDRLRNAAAISAFGAASQQRGYHHSLPQR